MNKRDHDRDTVHDGVLVSRRGVLRSGALAAALGVGGIAVPYRAAASHPSAAEAVNALWTAVLSNLPDNWGRWGPEDELGTLNFLEGEQAFRGLNAALRGPKDEIEVHTLQLSYTGDVIPTPDEGDASKVGDPVFPTRQPARRDQVVDNRHYEQDVVEPLIGGMKFSDDAFITRLFLQGSSQYDALSHIWYDTFKRRGMDELADSRKPLLYNGFEASTLSTPHDYDETVVGLRPADDPENDLQGIPSDYDPFSTDLVDYPIERTWEAARNDVNNAAEHGSVGRGVLLDVGRHADLPSDDEDRLEPGTCVTLSDLQETADAQGVDLRKRDIPLIRTGSIERARDPDAVWSTNEPGLCFSQDLVEWIHDMEFPLIGGDNLAVEKLQVWIDVDEDLNDDVRTAVSDEIQHVFDEHDDADFVDAADRQIRITNPLHPALITNLGLPICEIFYFRDLAESADDDGIYTFLYSGSPLKIVGGDGAPVNPTVVKASKKGNGRGNNA